MKEPLDVKIVRQIFDSNVSLIQIPEFKMAADLIADSPLYSYDVKRTMDADLEVITDEFCYAVDRAIHSDSIICALRTLIAHSDPRAVYCTACRIEDMQSVLSDLSGNWPIRYDGSRTVTSLLVYAWRYFGLLGMFE